MSRMKSVKNILEYSMKCIIITNNNVINLHGPGQPLEIYLRVEEFSSFRSFPGRLFSSSTLLTSGSERS